jgi:Flp pilus assembly pilin Flp
MTSSNSYLWTKDLREVFTPSRLARSKSTKSVIGEKVRKLLRKLWRENTGGSLVEYAFLVGLMLVTVAAIVAGFSGATRSSLSRASSSMAAGLDPGSTAAVSDLKTSGSSLHADSHRRNWGHGRDGHGHGHDHDRLHFQF